jgi:hypothetical protein
MCTFSNIQVLLQLLDFFSNIQVLLQLLDFFLLMVL